MAEQGAVTPGTVVYEASKFVRMTPEEIHDLKAGGLFWVEGTHKDEKTKRDVRGFQAFQVDSVDKADDKRTTRILANAGQMPRTFDPTRLNYFKSV